MRALPLLEPPRGCGLSAEELAEQLDRARTLRASARTVARSGDALRVQLGEVDGALVRTFVETEQRCCPLLAVAYDEETCVLTIGKAADEGRELVDLFAEVFDA